MVPEARAEDRRRLKERLERYWQADEGADLGFSWDTCEPGSSELSRVRMFSGRCGLAKVSPSGRSPSRTEPRTRARRRSRCLGTARGRSANDPYRPGGAGAALAGFSYLVKNADD